jgi:hypothetical protein
MWGRLAASGGLWSASTSVSKGRSFELRFERQMHFGLSDGLLAPQNYSPIGSISVGMLFKPSIAFCIAGRITPSVSSILFAPA